MIRSCRIATELLVALAAFAGFMQAGAAAEPPPLAQTVASDASLEAGQHHRYRLDLPAGRAVRLTVQQKDALLHLRWTSSAGAHSTLLSTQAGRLARLDVTLLADVATSFDIEINAAKADRVASYRIFLDAVHVASAEDRARVDAERSFAAAEAIRLAAGGVEQGNGDGDIAAATMGYRDAIERWHTLGASCEAMRAGVGLARLELARAHYPQAQRAARAALASGCRESADLSTEADRAAALRTLGAASGYQGDFEAAATASEGALALYRRTGDLRFQGVILGNLSPVYRSLGEMQKALASAQAALAIAEQTHDAQGVVFSRENIANSYLARGELALALASYRQALDDLHTTPYPMTEGLVWNELGAVYRRLGDDDEAQEAWAQARTIWDATGNRSGLTETLINQGHAALDDGNGAAATAAFMEALQIAVADHLQSPQLHAQLGLGRVAVAAGQGDAADAHLQAALKLAQEIGEVGAEAQVEQVVGDRHSRGNRLAEAKRHYARALELADRVADAAAQIVARASLARVAVEEGDLDGARALLEPVLASIEDQRVQIADPELRTGYFASQRAYYDLYIDVLMQLDRARPGRGYGSLALEASERARARALQDMLRERNMPIAGGVDPALLAAERDAEDGQRKVAYRSARLDQNASAGERAEVRREIDRVSRDLDRARGRIRTASPRYAELMHPQPLRLSAAQRELLDANSVVFEYWLGESRSYLWRITRASLQSWVLPGRAEIEGAADALREALLERAVAPKSASFEQLAATVSKRDEAVRLLAAALASRLLPDAAVADLANPILAVVADGELQRIPFNLFAPLSHREMVYLPSLAALHPLRAATPVREREPAVAIFADPVFEADDPRLPHSAEVPTSGPAALLAAAGRSGPGSWRRLAHAREEADGIAALFPIDNRLVAVDFAASRPAALEAPWSHYAYIHFATHALIDVRHPELSGVVLSLYDSQGRPQDGFLRMNDVFGLSMPAELVVLGVCDSTRERGRGAEGMFGLSRAFFHAGARRLLVSLWPVDDRASAQLMTAFYRHLIVEHRLPQAALRLAQIDMQADPRWQSPYYWAGFVVHGDWR